MPGAQSWSSARPCAAGSHQAEAGASSPRANTVRWAGEHQPWAESCSGSSSCARPLPAPTTQTPSLTSSPSYGPWTGPAWPSPAAGDCTGPLHSATLLQPYSGSATGRAVQGSSPQLTTPGHAPGTHTLGTTSRGLSRGAAARLPRCQQTLPLRRRKSCGKGHSSSLCEMLVLSWVGSWAGQGRQPGAGNGVPRGVKGYKRVRRDNEGVQ